MHAIARKNLKLRLSWRERERDSSQPYNVHICEIPLAYLDRFSPHVTTRHIIIGTFCIHVIVKQNKIAKKRKQLTYVGQVLQLQGHMWTTLLHKFSTFYTVDREFCWL